LCKSFQYETASLNDLRIHHLTYSSYTNTVLIFYVKHLWGCMYVHWIGKC
jgi:hypothetical protein